MLETGVLEVAALERGAVERGHRDRAFLDHVVAEGFAAPADRRRLHVAAYRLKWSRWVHVVVVPTERTDRAQEIHLCVEHMICDLVERDL